MNNTFSFGDLHQQMDYLNSSAPPRNGYYNRRNRTAQTCRNPFLYKTNLCDYYVARATCKFGRDCWYAHGADDLRTVKENERVYREQRAQEQELITLHTRIQAAHAHEASESYGKTLLPLREKPVALPSQEEFTNSRRFEAESEHPKIFYYPVRCKSISEAQKFAEGLESKLAAAQLTNATANYAAYLNRIEFQKTMVSDEKPSRRTSTQFSALSATFSTSSESGLCSPTDPFFNPNWP